MKGFSVYLAGLVASWEALAVAQPGAVVVRGDGFFAARFAEAVLNNAVVLAAGAVGPAEAVYADAGGFALWCRDDDTTTAAVLAGRGYARTETTRPMLCRLPTDVGERERDADREAGLSVLVDADPEMVAALNGVPPHLLRGVPGLRAYATAGFESALVLIAAGSDVNVSFVTTVPRSRRRGLAAAVLRVALADAYRRGARTATLQATPMAERLYARFGFLPVGRWQEWSREVPGRVGGSSTVGGVRAAR